MTDVLASRRSLEERLLRIPIDIPPAPLTPDGQPERRGPTSICLYTPSADPSGMGAHMVDLATEFLEGGLDVSFMAWPTEPGQRLLARARALGARTLPLPRPRDPGFAPAIEAFLADHPPQVFHVHVGLGAENWDGARAARRAGVPAVVQTQHLPWLVRGRRRRAPFFTSLEPVDRLITVSAAQRATYERIGVAPELMTTVPNGVRPRGPGLGRRAAREALGLRPDQPVVLTVGRLTVMKGQRHLVDAVPQLVERFPDVAVVVIGSGHLGERLHRQVAELGLEDHVHLPGHVGSARDLLDAADVFVLPSLHEGMPLAALEAMDAGLPVVATRVIGSSEVVDDGVTGALVPPGDPGALADALGSLLADEGLREQHGRAGRQRYTELFTSRRMAAQTLEVYERVLASVGAPAGSGAA